MNTKRFYTLLIAVAMTVAAHAQNAIDQMVEEYSTVGSSTFTTAVQRNPKTKRVEKVVKILQIRGPQAAKFIKTFKEEARKHANSTVNRQDDEETTIITEENAKNNRIYMLKRPDYPAMISATITIIIRMK